MKPENNVRTLMPRRDELQPSRPADGGHSPSGYNLNVSNVPSLWDYWPIILRHKWTILSAMLVALIVGAVVSFSTTPVYEAVGRVVINREGADTAGLKNSDAGGSDAFDDYMVAMDTQTHVLQSDAIAKLVIRRLNLDTDPAFAGRGSVLANSTSAAPSETREIEPHREAGLVAKFHGSPANQFDSPDSTTRNSFLQYRPSAGRQSGQLFDRHLHRAELQDAVGRHDADLRLACATIV